VVMLVMIFYDAKSPEVKIKNDMMLSFAFVRHRSEFPTHRWFQLA
jgi:hypothetical protein